MERLWRVRKHRTWVDARLQTAASAPGFDLQFFYDGTLVFCRRWPTREAALDDADRRLRDLQRAGWTSHW